MIELALGQVWQDLSGSKFVVHEQNIDDPRFHVEWTYVCEKAHDDGDFSYLCGKKWCRCAE